ncbi:MAG TPA: potassium-transporting ATPase subunit KdpC [Geodermatophilus sp.]|nr:potassium-transporting ATPase subunit KdpC [Geodermatophilus sp.]
MSALGSRRSRSATGRQLWAATRALLVFTVLLGIAYPLTLTGIARVVAGDRADGSPVEVDGTVVGSALIGQAFTDAGGDPLPQYFQSRPSASDHDGRASGGSNLGPNSEELAVLVEERRRAVAELEGVDPGEVPPDAVTASASGLDPGISPEYAALQVERVARERGVPASDVAALVAAATAGRDLGVIGAPYVDVLALNLSLDRDLR